MIHYTKIARNKYFTTLMVAEYDMKDQHTKITNYHIAI